MIIFSLNMYTVNDLSSINPLLHFGHYSMPKISI